MLVAPARGAKPRGREQCPRDGSTCRTARGTSFLTGYKATARATSVDEALNKHREGAEKTAEKTADICGGRRQSKAVTENATHYRP
jgi:hypothetical protein